MGKYQSKQITICGIRVNPVQIPEVVDIMEYWIRNKELGNYISVSNAYTASLSKKDLNLREAVNSSNLSVPDGFSLVMISKFYGYPIKRRVYGPDLMLEFLSRAEKKGYSNFFYGSTRENLHFLTEKLKGLFPLLKISGILADTFKDFTKEESSRMVDVINKASPDVLWVGLGCPKQECWMYEYKDKIKVPVMLGVGAAFDFIAGTKPQAPVWLRDNGFEWLFRFACEPKRLWKRYLVGGVEFLCYAAADIIRNKLRIKNVKTKA